ncbi:hypothetical protein SAMN05444006_1132 [Allgaiera indica]|uniref:Uncharacterized protein n=1 Tax=Allgaiera indica TaxID=765699 RepID=A0A1H3AEY4_9RHOB|nr:hypothetical protein SAMN05444006_1132 [Allgaiera indica]
MHPDAKTTTAITEAWASRARRCLSRQRRNHAQKTKRDQSQNHRETYLTQRLPKDRQRVLDGLPHTRINIATMPVLCGKEIRLAFRFIQQVRLDKAAAVTALSGVPGFWRAVPIKDLVVMLCMFMGNLPSSRDRQMYRSIPWARCLRSLINPENDMIRVSSTARRTELQRLGASPSSAQIDFCRAAHASIATALSPETSAQSQQEKHRIRRGCGAKPATRAQYPRVDIALAPTGGYDGRPPP